MHAYATPFTDRTDNGLYVVGKVQGAGIWVSWLKGGAEGWLKGTQHLFLNTL